MTNPTAEQILDAYRWRYATKKFDTTRRIPETTWAALEQAAVLAPSSFGLQPWRFYVVTDAKVRARLRTAAYNQPQITDASHLVVFARRSPWTSADVERFVDRITHVRAVARSSIEDYRRSMLGTAERTDADKTLWATRQVYIALGFFLSAAAMLGVDACPMEGFEPSRFDDILGLRAEGYASTVLAAAGYRAADDEFALLKKVRFPVEETVRRI